MADNFTNKLGLQLYGNTEYDRAKKGFDWAQSINGNTQYSAFSKIDIWADYISKLVGSGTLYGGLTDCISAINSLNNTMQNTVQGVIVNGTELNKVNNKVSFTVPTKTSDITNDSHIDIATTEDVIDTTAIGFGDTINVITEVNRDNNGHVENIKTVKSTFPIVTTNPIVNGNGNAITGLDVNNGIINIKKEETFATKEEFDSIPTHSNIEQLNKIGENGNGEVTYNGKVISGGTGLRNCIVGQSFGTTDNPWYKFASVNIESIASDREIIFNVSTGYTYHTDKVGILKAHIRIDDDYFTDGLFRIDNVSLKWEYVSKDINLEDFVLAYDDSNEGIVKVELWVRVNKPWLKYHFTVLQEGDLDKNYPFWTLYNKSSQGSEAEIPSNFTQVASTMITLKNDTIKSHTHDNKTQLDKIGENESGQFTYNGQVISGGGGGTGSVDSITVNGTNYTPTDGVVTLPNYSAQFVGEKEFGGTQDEITTSQFISLLQDMGAFCKGYWCTRGRWDYSLNQIITDTGCGNINLAGCVVEVFNDINSNGKYYTIRITTPSTSIRGTDNAEFTYVNNDDDNYSYNPCWRRSYNTLNKPEEISTMQSDIENLKNNVVNWKQPIVTAVNDKCSTSLTTETSGDDIATYISNIKTLKDITTGMNRVDETLTFEGSSGSKTQIPYTSVFVKSISGGNATITSDNKFIILNIGKSGEVVSILYRNSYVVSSNSNVLILGVNTLYIQNTYSTDSRILTYYTLI